MPTGTVKFFNAQKGFGFIQQDGGGEDVFVHISAVERAGLEGLAEGQELEFNLVDRGGKVSAQDLQVVGDVIPVQSRGGDRGERGGEREAAPRRELTGEKATGKSTAKQVEEGEVAMEGELEPSEQPIVKAAAVVDAQAA